MESLESSKRFNVFVSKVVAAFAFSFFRNITVSNIQNVR